MLDRATAVSAYSLSAEPPAPLSGLTLPQRVALAALHTSAVAGVGPIAFFPEIACFRRVAPDGSPCGPVITPATIAALERRGMVASADKERDRRTLRTVGRVVRLTKAGAWYARTIERAHRAKISEALGISSSS